LLYLATAAKAISLVLVRRDTWIQRPMYYVSRVLKEAELNYNQIEKMAYVVLITAP